VVAPFSPADSKPHVRDPQRPAHCGFYVRITSAFVCHQYPVASRNHHGSRASFETRLPVTYKRAGLRLTWVGKARHRADTYLDQSGGTLPSAGGIPLPMVTDQNSRPPDDPGWDAPIYSKKIVHGSQLRNKCEPLPIPLEIRGYFAAGGHVERWTIPSVSRPPSGTAFLMIRTRR